MFSWTIFFAITTRDDKATRENVEYMLVQVFDVCLTAAWKWWRVCETDATQTRTFTRIRMNLMRCYVESAILGWKSDVTIRVLTTTGRRRKCCDTSTFIHPWCSCFKHTSSSIQSEPSDNTILHKISAHYILESSILDWGLEKGFNDGFLFDDIIELPLDIVAKLVLVISYI
jgi:hypothetical protein